MTWDRVNQDKREIALEPSKTERHGIAVRIPLTGVLHAALASARLADPFGARLFPEMDGVYQSRHTVYPFHKVLEAAELKGKGYTFHSWRHTFRTRLAEAGVSNDTAKRLGGWTEDTTAERYDHDAHMRELQAAVDAGAARSVVAG